MRVQGSETQAQPLVIGKDTVYVHTNIEQVETEHGLIWEYDEEQYTIPEYLVMENEKLRQELVMQGEVVDTLILDSLGGH